MADLSSDIYKNIRFLKKSNPFKFLNLLVVSLFVLLGLYAKLGGGERGNAVSILFSDFFTETYPFYGVFTNASDMLWCIAASICWFTYSNLRTHGMEKVDKNYKDFFLWSAILLTLFLADDLFRLTLSLKVYLDIPKQISYLTYGISAMAYGWIYRKLLLATPYLLLLLAMGLLIISGATDIVGLPGKGTPALLEDGTKLLAVLNICIFFCTVCRKAFSQIFSSNRADERGDLAG
jgi:hypothetical protein